jgi:hypothetical protein
MGGQMVNIMIKRIICSVILLFIAINCFAQFKREVTINPATDTTSVEFPQIFKLWENYMDELLCESAKSAFILNKMDTKLKSFWNKDDTIQYPFPDLYYAFKTSYGNAFYPMLREFFLGITKRDTDIYELKTMFLYSEDKNSKGFPSLIISVPVKKDGDSYTFLNEFSLNKPNLKSKILFNITYYYAPTYHFNDSLADLLEQRIKDFTTYFQIKKPEPITYLVADNMTEIASWFGIDYFEFDYDGSLNMIEGRASKSSNMIMSAGGCENYLHEIIHILLKDIGRGKYYYFEEGVACYFGEHVGHDYLYHAKRLKEYLDQNSWVDLSKSLSKYYKNDSGQVFYTSVPDNPSIVAYTYQEKEMKTNLPYIIHAVICDIAYKKGNTKVKELLLCKANNEQEFYQSIEKVLGIKQADLDIYLRNFINNNYSN